jgi:hypothetical protein
MRNLLKVFTHDQLGNRTPDLSLSGPTPLPLDHELLDQEGGWGYSTDHTVYTCAEASIVVLHIQGSK